MTSRRGLIGKLDFMSVIAPRSWAQNMSIPDLSRSHFPLASSLFMVVISHQAIHSEQHTAQCNVIHTVLIIIRNRRRLTSGECTRIAELSACLSPTCPSLSSSGTPAPRAPRAQPGRRATYAPGVPTISVGARRL
jgi:hypothetical protein